MKKFPTSALLGALLLLLAALPSLHSQNTSHFFGSRHLAEIQAGLLHAPRPQAISQSPPASGASVETRSFPGGTAALRYHYSFLPRWSVDVGGSGGYYQMLWRINATAQWLGEFPGFEDERLYNTDGVFFAANLGAAYHLLAGEERLLALGGGVQAVYFPEARGGSAIGRGEFARPLQFNATYHYGKDRKVFPAAYLSLQYFQKATSWLVFSAALEGAWSGEEPGEFFSALTGASEELLSVHRQPYRPVSLRVGLGYTFGK